MVEKRVGLLRMEEKEGRKEEKELERFMKAANCSSSYPPAVRYGKQTAGLWCCDRAYCGDRPGQERVFSDLKIPCFAREYNLVLAVD